MAAAAAAAWHLAVILNLSSYLSSADGSPPLPARPGRGAGRQQVAAGAGEGSRRQGCGHRGPEFATAPAGVAGRQGAAVQCLLACTDAQYWARWAPRSGTPLNLSSGAAPLPVCTCKKSFHSLIHQARKRREAAAAEHIQRFRPAAPKPQVPRAAWRQLLPGSLHAVLYSPGRDLRCRLHVLRSSGWCPAGLGQLWRQGPGRGDAEAQVDAAA